MPENSLFVTQIADAMFPLIGIVDNTDIKAYGLQSASSIYDRLVEDYHTARYSTSKFSYKRSSRRNVFRSCMQEVRTN